MIYKIKHDPSQYLKGGIKLWAFRLFRRIFPQRKSITLFCILIAIVNLIISKIAFFIFLLFIVLVFVADLIIYIINLSKNIYNMRVYMLNENEDLELFTTNEFIYFKQYSNEFHRTKWLYIKDLYILKNPNLISFRNKQSQYEFILYENEFEDNYKKFVKEVVEKVNVIPLVNQL